MAVSNLLAALFVMLGRNKDIEVAWATWHVEGILGDTLFRLPHFTDEVSTNISSQSMVLIEAKRFLSIVSPIDRKSVV